MRRSALPTTLLTILGVTLTAVAPCTTSGPARRTFAAGSLVIPMDNCYQKRDATAAAQTVGCNATADDGVLRAYGLVYFLLKHDVRVWWAIDGRGPSDATPTPKASVTAADLTVDVPPPGVEVARKLDWASGELTSFGFPPGTSITYIGGPFVIEAGQDATKALDLLKNDPDFARFRGEKIVDVHQVQSQATANEVRPLTGPPPKLAILAGASTSGRKTSSNVMYQYAVAAGLSWPCKGDGDCAGGLGLGCDKQAVLDYLSNPAGDVAIPQRCNGALCAPNFNAPGQPGLIYDVLCDGDFIPKTSAGYSSTQLAAGGYKLLWVPHWDTSGTTPTGSSGSGTPAFPPTTAEDRLAWQLLDIAAFVSSGNNLFVECLGIQAMEGILGQTSVNGNPYGIAATRFQSTGGMFNWDMTGWSGPSTILVPSQPNMQIGDFAYSLVSGAITTFYPDHGSPASAYRPGVERLITRASSATATPPWDVATTFQVAGADGAELGTVAYLGGHDYSPTADVDASGNPVTTPSAHVHTGQTAGTRIVLNTLFNLGFACADPNDECSTGQLGVCAKGLRKCVGGAIQCVPQAQKAAEVCGNGLDDNCDGKVDEECVRSECTPGATRACAYPAEYQDRLGKGACKAATQSCDGNGFWGPCSGQVLPQPEVCNGKDDDCSGTVDDGKLCPAGASCTNGICLPDHCGAETARCPQGYTCGPTGTCQADTCPTTCAAGTVCVGGACKDPCADLHCGAGDLCSGGQCFAGGCALSGCPQGQTCLSGACVQDPCLGNTCPQGTFCRAGDCVRSCAYVECAAGQSCSADGFCVGAAPACPAGQVAVAGACQGDPCAGVTCGIGRVCSAGACVDAPCAHVQCAVGRCVDGQCVSTDVVVSTEVPVKPAGGGCGSAGPGELASLAVALAAVVRRRRTTPRLARSRPALRSACALAAAVAVATTGGACSKSSGCPSGQTSCGGACVDLQSAADHCGACGHACNAAGGFQCLVGACAFPTGNPFLSAIAPAVLGAGDASATITLTGTAFRPGATVRITGASLDGEYPACPAAGGQATCVTVASDTSATVTLDASSAASGTAQVRLLNPGTNPDPTKNRLVSNSLALPVAASAALTGMDPTGLRQDQLPTTLKLEGGGLGTGAVVAITGPDEAEPGSAVQKATLTLPATAVDATHVAVTLPDSLAIGTYSVVVSTPSSAPSRALKLRVNEAPPTVAGISPTSSPATATFGGSVTGNNLYPSSVVRVTQLSGPGGAVAISSMPLATRCRAKAGGAAGVDATGRCQNGELWVEADLSTLGANTVLSVVVVNPGDLSSQNGVNFQVTP